MYSVLAGVHDVHADASVFQQQLKERDVMLGSK